MKPHHFPVSSNDNGLPSISREQRIILKRHSSSGERATAKREPIHIPIPATINTPVLIGSHQTCTRASPCSQDSFPRVMKWSPTFKFNQFSLNLSNSSAKVNSSQSNGSSNCQATESLSRVGLYPKVTSLCPPSPFYKEFKRLQLTAVIQLL